MSSNNPIKPVPSTFRESILPQNLQELSKNIRRLRQKYDGIRAGKIQPVEGDEANRLNEQIQIAQRREQLLMGDRDVENVKIAQVSLRMVEFSLREVAQATTGREYFKRRGYEIRREILTARLVKLQIDEALQALRLRLLTEWQQKALAVPSAKSRSAFRIDGRGNQGFVEVVNKVLDDLKEHVPHRYVEALTYFPQAVYDTSLLQKKHPRGGRVVAYSKGYFALDGRDNYLGFRWTFLHEVGHTVAIAQRKTKSDVEENEQVADNYAFQVLEEIELINRERYNIEERFGKKLPAFNQWRRNELVAAGGWESSVDIYLQMPNVPFS